MPAAEAATNSRQNHPDKTGGRPWSTQEVAQLREFASLGAESVAELLDRSVWSVRMQAARLRISLRRTGSRAGRVLGQAAGERTVDDVMLAQWRDDVLAGRIDVRRAERRMKAIGRGAPRCPSCGIRPQEVLRTGFCLDCHRELRADMRALEEAANEGRRNVDRQRQRKHRARKEDD